MRVRAIQDLVQYDDAAFFAQVEEGAALCVANANRIADDCKALNEAKRLRGAEILRLAAREEAAKVLILLDAVRCPRSRLPAEFARQLQYFNDHLAKGIYAQYCDRRPATFGEVGRWVERERKEFYLDGPNDVDWVFYNEVLRRREETIYVDFVENDGERLWHDPMMIEKIGVPMLGRPAPSVVRLVSALSQAGCLQAKALATIAEVWRPVPIDDTFRWCELRDLNLKTLQIMERYGLVTEETDDVCSVIIDEWLFPMYGLDLRKKRVDKNVLRDVRRQWNIGE